MKLSTRKNIQPIIQKMGHLCIDMKVWPLHNLIKKQCLITLTSPFFVVIGYAHERIFESTLLV